MYLSKLGASIVVNDIGSTLKGEGATNRAADDTVREIASSGGKAIANYDSVEYGQKIVESALSNFGRIDAIVNNAGYINP